MHSVERLKLAHASLLTLCHMHLLLNVAFVALVYYYSAFDAVAKSMFAFGTAGFYSCLYALCNITLFTSQTPFPMHWVSVFATFECFALVFIGTTNTSALPYILGLCLTVWFFIGGMFRKASADDLQDTCRLFPQHLTMIHIFSIACYSLVSMTMFCEACPLVLRITANISMFGILMSNNVHTILYFQQNNASAMQVNNNILMYWIAFAVLFMMCLTHNHDAGSPLTMFLVWFVVFWLAILILNCTSIYKLCTAPTFNVAAVAQPPNIDAPSSVILYLV